MSSSAPTPAALLNGFHGSWRHWLPDEAIEHLLCLDDDSGHSMLALAGACERLTVVPVHGAAVAALPRLAQAAGLTNVEFAAKPGLAGLRTRDYAGAVANAACWRWSAGDRAPRQPQESSRPPALPALLAALRAVLPDEAFVLVTAPNRFAHGRIAGSERATGSPVSAGAGLRRAVTTAGWSQARVWPLLLRRRRIVEVLTERGYAPLTECDPGVWRRRLAFGPRASRWLAPAYMVLGAARTLTTRADGLGSLGGPGSRVRRCLVQAEKLIVATEGPERADPGRVILVADGADARWRQARHAAALLAARGWPSDLRKLAPAPCDVDASDGADPLVMERLHGVCYDGPVDDLEAITASATEILIRLHDATASPCQVDEHLWRTTLGAPFRAAAARHPGTERLLHGIERMLRPTLAGLRIPLGRVHGDFKVENLVIDPRTREIRGIIDWELSEARGLPLLDLLYLLAYNRMVSRGQSFERVVAEVVLPGGWSPSEAALIERYIGAVRLSATIASTMPAMLLVHALAYRFTYDLERDDDRAAILGMLEALASALGADLALAPTGTGGPR